MSPLIPRAIPADQNLFIFLFFMLCVLSSYLDFKKGEISRELDMLLWIFMGYLLAYHASLSLSYIPYFAMCFIFFLALFCFGAIGGADARLLIIGALLLPKSFLSPLLFFSVFYLSSFFFPDRFELEVLKGGKKVFAAVFLFALLFSGIKAGIAWVLLTYLTVKLRIALSKPAQVVDVRHVRGGDKIMEGIKDGKTVRVDFWDWLLRRKDFDYMPSPFWNDPAEVRKNFKDINTVLVKRRRSVRALPFVFPAFLITRAVLGG